MNRKLNKYAIVAFVLLATLLLPIASNLMVSAQTDNAIVVMLPTTGGTTSPAQGTHTYANGTNIDITATPNTGYKFEYWIISGGPTPGHADGQSSTIIDPETGEIIGSVPRPSTTGIDSIVFTANPATITCGYGYTYQYQAFFSQEAAPSPTPAQNEAVVIVMPTAGGTVSPAPGMYTYPNGAQIPISATPDSGYEFRYWLISGGPLIGHDTTGYSIITDPETGETIAQVPRPNISGIDSLTFSTNPATITCGYGYTFTYTAVFGEATPTVTPTPTSQQTPTPSPAATTNPPTEPEMSWTLWIVAAVVVIVIVIIVVAAVVMRKK